MSSPPPQQSIDWTVGSVSSFDAVPITYQMGGEGPISLVFVHGWSCDRGYWSAQLDHFAVDHTVVAVDLGGHGQSGLGRPEWTMAGFGADVAAVLDGLLLERVVLVGHSMGASVVVEAALLAPDRIVGLVVVDDLLDLDASFSPADIEERVAPLAEDFAAATRGFVSTELFVSDSDPALVERIAEDTASGPAEVGTDALRNLLSWYGRRAREAVAGIRAPIRAINSDMDPTNLVAAGRHGIEVSIVPGVGHFVMMEDPDTFNSLLAGAIGAFSD